MSSPIADSVAAAAGEVSPHVEVHSGGDDGEQYCALLQRFLEEAAILCATVHRKSYLWNLLESLGGGGGDLSAVREISVTSYVGNRALIALCSTIRTMLPGVTTLAISDASLFASDAEPSTISGNTTIQAICSLLCGHPALHTLDLSKNDIGTAALQSIIALAKGTPSLQVVRLEDTCLEEHQLWHLNAVLALNAKRQEVAKAHTPKRGSEHNSVDRAKSSKHMLRNGSAGNTISGGLPSGGLGSFITSSSLMYSSQRMSMSTKLSVLAMLSPKRRGTLAATTDGDGLPASELGSMRSTAGGTSAPSSPSGASPNLKRPHVSITYLRSKKDPYCLSELSMRYIRTRMPPPSLVPTVTSMHRNSSSSDPINVSSGVPWPRVLANLEMTRSTDAKTFANIPLLLTPSWLKGSTTSRTDVDRVTMREVIRGTCVFKSVCQQLFLPPPTPPVDNGIPLSVQTVGVVGKSLAQVDYESVVYRQRCQQDVLLDAVVDCVSVTRLCFGEAVWERGDCARSVYLIPFAMDLPTQANVLAPSPSRQFKAAGNTTTHTTSAASRAATLSSIAGVVEKCSKQTPAYGALLAVSNDTLSTPHRSSPTVTLGAPAGDASVRLATCASSLSGSVVHARCSDGTRTIPQGQFFGYDEALPIDSTTPPTRVRETQCNLVRLQPTTSLEKDAVLVSSSSSSHVDASEDKSHEEGAGILAPQEAANGSVEVWHMRREAFEMFFSEPLFAQRIQARRMIDAMTCMLGVDPQLRLYVGDVLLSPRVIFEKELPLAVADGSGGRVAPETVDVLPFTELLDHVIVVEEGSMCVRRHGQEMCIFGRGDIVSFDPSYAATKGEACEGLRCTLKSGNMPSWKFHVLSTAELIRTLPKELVEVIVHRTQKTFKDVDARLDNSGWGRRSKRAA